MSTPAKPSGTFYSRVIQKPKTRRDGFANFVQLIINNIEAGAPQEALIGAVDLLDCIQGNANPYASVTDAPDDASTSNAEFVAAVARAKQEGIAEGKRLALAAMTSCLASIATEVDHHGTEVAS